MDNSLLYEAAATWKKLCDYRYSFTYGYKKQLYTINLTFDPADFPHLAGFQYLKDLTLPRYTPAKHVDRILDGKILQSHIEKGSDYESMVKPRLMALVSLDGILDHEFILHSFIPRYAAFVTQIKADFLISSEFNGVNFVFLIRNGERNVICDCTCVSTFAKGERDYSIGQRPYTLLKKTRTLLSSGEETVLYIKPSFTD